MEEITYITSAPLTHTHTHARTHKDDTRRGAMQAPQLHATQSLNRCVEKNRLQQSTKAHTLKKSIHWHNVGEQTHTHTHIEFLKIVILTTL